MREDPIGPMKRHTGQPVSGKPTEGTLGLRVNFSDQWVEVA